MTVVACKHGGVYVCRLTHPPRRPRASPRLRSLWDFVLDLDPTNVTVPEHHRFLEVDNCNYHSEFGTTTQIRVPGEELVHVDFLQMSRRARLAATKPQPDAGSVGALVVDMIVTDHSVFFDCPADTELVLLGPERDVPDGFPVVNTVAWAEGNVRVSRVDRKFVTATAAHPRNTRAALCGCACPASHDVFDLGLSLHRFMTDTLDLPGHLRVDVGGHMVLPPRVFANSKAIELRGKLSGATTLTLSGTCTLDIYSTAHTNTTAPGEFASTDIIVGGTGAVQLHALSRFTLKGAFKFSGSSNLRVHSCTDLVMTIKWFDLLDSTWWTWPCQVTLHATTRFHVAASASAKADAVGCVMPRRVGWPWWMRFRRALTVFTLLLLQVPVQPGCARLLPRRLFGRGRVVRRFRRLLVRRHAAPHTLRLLRLARVHGPRRCQPGWRDWRHRWRQHHPHRQRHRGVVRGGVRCPVPERRLQQRRRWRRRRHRHRHAVPAGHRHHSRHGRARRHV